MQDSQLSRQKNFKFPKIIDNTAGKLNSIADVIGAQEALATASGLKFKQSEAAQKAQINDAEWAQICKIPEESSDLIVVTKIKKLGAYIIAITEKSPAKFRGVFVNRLQNYCLDALQDIFNANFIRQDTPENKKRRENYQAEAIIKLKMLAYIALIAENSGCILKRQYKQISIQVAEAINLAAAWKKSDDEKWKNKQ